MRHHVESESTNDCNRECHREDGILLFLVGRWELSDDLALHEVVLVHALIVDVSLSLFKPDVKHAKIPVLYPMQAGVKGHDLYAILSINKVKLIREVY